MSGTSGTTARAAKPQWLLIDAPEPGYAGSVATLVAGIARTRAGRSVLERVRASGSPVRIERPAARTDPPNAWAERRAGADGAQIVLAYDPADWPNPALPDAPGKDVVLFRLFGHALALASGAAAEADLPAMLDAYLREREGDA